MERAYVRRNEVNGGPRTWTPIGWYCRYCGNFRPDRRDTDMPILTDAHGVRWTYHDRID